MSGAAPASSSGKAPAWATVTFDEKEAYNVVGNPKGTVRLKDKSGRYGDWLSWALVDTGANRLHLPDAAAESVGLTLAGARPVPVMTASGAEIVMHQLDVDVEIQGARITTACNFAPNAKPLIGRGALFKAMKTAGFNSSDWLIEWHQKPGGQPSGRQSPTPTAPSPTTRQPSAAQPNAHQLRRDKPKVSGDQRRRPVALHRWSSGATARAQSRRAARALVETAGPIWPTRPWDCKHDHPRVSSEQGQRA